ncbi:HAD-IIB family hydrolase [Desulfoluna sp.]|uniref:HAD-IIB family hydrolase n=1 Tax=Desulfoluna sp. TaxID=2045199 RepID=UPI002617A81B|nr:HAD-IIB family hydrolase [Desulfoluna sp.]
MNSRRLLLCTDLDRTLIPNGPQAEHPEARHHFRRLCCLPEVLLAYVTGRHQALVQQAISDYALPEPDFAITDVGTQIYRVTDGGWMAIPRWQQEIGADWQGGRRKQLQAWLSPLTELRLQEASRQNRFKLSYYLSLDRDQAWVMGDIENRLKQKGVNVSLIWSVDEQKNIGLIDVLPCKATKLHALEFLQRELGYQPHEVLFAGDSGNDLTVLGSAIRSVLVANASAEIKRQAQQLAAQNGQAESLYLATETASDWGGNYAAGILQGVWHFAPEFRDRLQPPEGSP